MRMARVVVTTSRCGGFIERMREYRFSPRNFLLLIQKLFMARLT